MAGARGPRVTVGFLALAQRHALSSSWALESEAQPPFRELGGHSGQWEPVETAEQGGGGGWGTQSGWGGDRVSAHLGSAGLMRPWAARGACCGGSEEGVLLIDP